MVTLYAQLIINHRKTIGQVPTSLRLQVVDKLAEMGYNAMGEPLNKEDTT